MIGLARPSLRTSRADAWLVAFALLHALVLSLRPPFAVIGILFWWNANTVGHWFLHRPFFREARWNRAFSLFLSLVQGVPQTLWRERHLAHHRGDDVRRVRRSPRLVQEGAACLLLHLTLAFGMPAHFFGAWLPGLALGLALAVLQGREEHRRGTTSHRGRLYNVLFFNDGHHVEHHMHPARHWTALPGRSRGPARLSRWPPCLRFLEHLSLTSLERLVLRLPGWQRRVLAVHRRALRVQLAELERAPADVLVVGGGLFPRTALLLAELLPTARVTVLDRELAHLRIARAHLGAVGARMRFLCAAYEPRSHGGFDLVVIPLCYDGDRRAIYEHPPAPVVLVHDWWHSRRGRSVPIHRLLWKRLNRVEA